MYRKSKTEKAVITGQLGNVQQSVLKVGEDYDRNKTFKYSV